MSEETTEATSLTEENENEGTTEQPRGDDGTFKSPESKQAVLADLAKEREKRRAYEKELAELRKTLESDGERALREARESAVTEAENKYKGLIVRSEAKTALLQAGLTSGVERMLKLIDLSAVKIGEDGSLEGLDSQIDEIKKDFAELFAAKRAPRADAAPKQKVDSPKSSAEKIAEQILRGN